MKFWQVIPLLTLSLACGGTTQKRLSSGKESVRYQVRGVESYSASNCPTTKFENQNMNTVIEAINGCMAKKDWNKVNELALHLRSLNEKLPLGYYYSSLASEALNNMPESMWFIQKALDRDTNNSLFQYQLGRLLLKQGNTSDAFVRFNEVLRLDPSHVEANAMVAKVYFNNKVYDLALKHYEKVLSDVKSDEAITACYVSAMQLGDYVKSLNYLNRIPRSRQTLESKLDLAFLYEKTNNITGALNIYESVLKQNKDKNISFDNQQVSDKIKELRTQLRSIAAAKEEKEISK